MKKLAFTRYEAFLIFSVITILIFSLIEKKTTPDSLNYLIMAAFSNMNQLCLVNGQYNGVFGCGYPILIQLTSLIFSTDLFVSGKLLNCLILVISYCIFSHIFNSRPLALILTLLPFNVVMSTYTLSENAVLLSFILYCLAIFRIESKNNLDITSYIIAFTAILIGCMSRYAFAPFAIFIFLASFIVIQRKALLLLPVFILNALIFIVYEHFGSGRSAATESICYLISGFSSLCVRYSFKHLLSFTPVLILNIKSLRFNKLNEILKSNWGMFFILTGVGYLALSFTLRAIIHYDFYGVRTVGFGVSLIASGILVSYKNVISKIGFPVVITCIILCQIFLVTPERAFALKVLQGIESLFLNIAAPHF